MFSDTSGPDIVASDLYGQVRRRASSLSVDEIAGQNLSFKVSVYFMGLSPRLQ